MKVYIDKGFEFKEEIKYIFEIFLLNKQIEYFFSDDLGNSDFIISNDSKSDLVVNEKFFRDIKSKKYHYKNYFNDECIIRRLDNSIDYLCCAFYMLNSIQEFGCEEQDEHGRFCYKNSYQYQFSNIEENLVQNCFDKLLVSNEKLSKHSRKSSKSKFFLSHDIDTVYGSFAQDGYYALKKGRLDIILKLIFNLVMFRPSWLNIGKIMSIESQYDFRSIFFWLVNKGKLNKKEKNADYSITNKKIRLLMNQVEQSGWENGLHKSISDESFGEEINKLGVAVSSNRYHYLKFRLPNAYKDLQQSGLKLDSSLGFAEVIGFRNNYGLPFRPFDFENRKPFDFIEVPLNIMDQTFFGYNKLPPKQISKKIISFFEKNNSNCVISILWHNNFFSNYKYKGYLDAYKELLAYFFEKNINCVTTKELINSFKPQSVN